MIVKELLIKSTDEKERESNMGAFGTFDPRDPMRNAAFSAQFTDYENKRCNTPISPVKRRIAYIAMFLLAAFLITIIALFII